MAAIPTLETDRLILRGPTLADFPEMAAMWSDPVVVRGVGGVPFTEEEVWARLLKYVGHWELLDYGMWIVSEKNGDFVGEVGFFDLHRAITPVLDIPELGWVLASKAHGKGFATEAVQRILAWGEQRFAGHTYSCIIDTDNTPSLRVAEKCGFREHVRTVYKGTAVIVFRR
jgi:RimJ/RimL family protein N-acetyltransferase